MEQRNGARLETRDGKAVMLQGVKASGDLRGLMFEARVEQRFCNSTDRSVEVVYTFPLPWGAVLLGVVVQLGDKHLTGAVVEKKMAEASYEEALSEGNAAIMLERNHDESYSLNLGNLAPQETCVVTLRYAQTLKFEQRGLRLLLPTVIAPRYGDAVADGGLQAHQVPVHSLLAEYPFDIELRLHGDLARARVASPSHPIGVSSSGAETGSVITVSLARRGALDRDFVLVVDQLDQDSLAVIARDCVVPDGVVALASFCPRVPAEGSTAIAVKILVDCSGSMAGDSMNAAQRALQAIVNQLGKGDRVSLSRFGSTVEHRSRGLWNATEATRLAAQRWVSNLKADLGGTAMEAALKSTFGLAQSVASDVLIVTDGEISAIDSTIAAAVESGHRLFVVGIGSSPAESHLRRLALATGGACDFVAPGEAVEPAVLRMFSRLRSPRLTDLKVVWPGNATPEWMSPVSASMFDGDAVSVFALLKQIPEGEVHLMAARVAGGPSEVVGSVVVGRAMQAGDTLPRVVAWQRVQEAATRMEMLLGPDRARLAVDYQLVTSATNFLLVHQRAENEKPADMPELHQVQQMMPAGWGGTASVLNELPLEMNMCMSVDHSMLDSADVFDPFSDDALFARAPALEAPAFRSGRAERRARIDALQRGGMDRYEIPAFLRTPGSAFDRTAPGYWSVSEGYTGLTPLGLREWLRVTPENQWPTLYEALRKIGLGGQVVDWLELILAIHDDKVLPEGSVVEAFLAVVAQLTFGEAPQPRGPLQGIKALTARMKDVFGGHSGDGVAAMTGRVVAALEHATVDHWPDQMFTLDAADATSIPGVA